MRLCKTSLLFFFFDHLQTLIVMMWTVMPSYMMYNREFSLWYSTCTSYLHQLSKHLHFIHVVRDQYLSIAILQIYYYNKTTVNNLNALPSMYYVYSIVLSNWNILFNDTYDLHQSMISWKFMQTTSHYLDLEMR